MKKLLNYLIYSLIVTIFVGNASAETIRFFIKKEIPPYDPEKCYRAGCYVNYENYDIGLGLNFAFPWAYIAVTNSFSFNDYKKEDTSVNNTIRSDFTNMFDIMLTKAIGDIFPTIDPNRSLFINLSYEKVISEANIINYDYISDSFSLSFSRSFRLN